MPLPAEMVERHSRALAELGELGLSLTRQLHADAMAAGTPEARVELAKTFHTVSRTVRQTISLEAGLARDQFRDEAEARREIERVAEQAARTAQAVRKRALRNAIEHLAWEAWELPDFKAEDIVRKLDRRLEEAEFDLAESAGDQILRLCRRLGYTLDIVENDDADDDDDDEDDEDLEDDDPDDDAGEAADARTEPQRPAPTAAQPTHRRLAPPMDLPSWHGGDTS